MRQFVPYFLLAVPLWLGTFTCDGAAIEPVTLTYAVNGAAKLTISPGSIVFPDADPSHVPLIPATDNPVNVTVKIRKEPSTATLATLVCQCTPLTSGPDSIPASNITWTATGQGFQAGTLNSSLPQQAGSWPLSGSFSGTFNFYLRNLWTYSVGSYTGTIVYTLAAP
jgi:hypothetical protein